MSALNDAGSKVISLISEAFSSKADYSYGVRMNRWEIVVDRGIPGEWRFAQIGISI